MRKQHPAGTNGDSTEDESTEWIEQYSYETIEAVAPNEATAGLNVTVHDLGEIDEPTMYGLHQYYPPEDDVEGKSVYVHGEHAALQVISALAEAVSLEFDELPWDDVER